MNVMERLAELDAIVLSLRKRDQEGAAIMKEQQRIIELERTVRHELEGRILALILALEQARFFISANGLRIDLGPEYAQVIDKIDAALKPETPNWGKKFDDADVDNGAGGQ